MPRVDPDFEALKRGEKAFGGLFLGSGEAFEGFLWPFGLQF